MLTLPNGPAALPGMGEVTKPKSASTAQRDDSTFREQNSQVADSGSNQMSQVLQEIDSVEAKERFHELTEYM